MTNSNAPQAAAAKSAAPLALWLVLLAAAGAFALTMGTRQTMGLFLSSPNTSTARSIGSISLAFAFGQLWLAVGAALVNLPIREAQLVRPTTSSF